MVSHSSYFGLSLFLAFAFSLLSVSESEREAISEPNLTQAVRPCKNSDLHNGQQKIRKGTEDQDND